MRILAGRRWLRSPRPTVRLRLTAVYTALFLLSGAGLLAITYVLVAKGAPGSNKVMVRGAVAAGPTSTCVATANGPLPTPAQLGQCITALQAQVVAQRADYLNTLLIGSAVALGVMTLVALGLGWLVSGRVLSPLRTITWAARNISASNLHERLALQGPDDELKELGDTMDGLLARLEGAFCAQRQFVANASHELRTPLARQRTLMEVALTDPDRSIDSLAAACERVLAAGQQSERLIEGLLMLACSQRGLDRWDPVDLSAIVTEVALTRQAEAHQRGIRLSVQARPALLAGDARLAERLVTNLIDNAIRHNLADGGEVTLATLMADGQAVLVVSNTGPIVHPADVPGLFEPFRHGREQRTGDSPGLGLSIVAAIAGAHGAGLWAMPRPSGGLDVQVRFHDPKSLLGLVASEPAEPPENAGGVK